MTGLLLLSAALVASALAAGLEAGRPWVVELLVVVAVAQGFAAGHVFRRFAPGRGKVPEVGAKVPEVGAKAPGDEGRLREDEERFPEDEGGRRLLERAAGPEGRYLLFLVSVLFAAVEAHAVGAGMVRGAPAGALALLVPPLAVGTLALRGAVGASPSESVGESGGSRGAVGRGSGSEGRRRR